MAGDEKHARELIAEARAYMTSSQNQHGRGGLVDQLADALEAALPGDDDSLWAVAMPGFEAEPFTMRLTTAELIQRGFGWPPKPGYVLMRSRDGETWQPVEEVPRGSD